MTKLDDFTDEELRILTEKMNDDFKYFLDAIPYVEFSDNIVNGRTVVSKGWVGEYGEIPFGDIIFELQWNLFSRKKRRQDIEKVLVGNLVITPKEIAKSLCVRRSVILTLKYIMKNE
jgi:hypothetical protein